MSLMIKRGRVMTQGTSRQMRGPMGDPGLLGGLLGGIGGLITGGPLGAIGGAVAGFKGKPSGPQAMTAPQSRPVSGINLPGFGPPGAGVGGKFTPRFSIGEQAGTQLACPSGYHPNKTGYYTQSEGWIEAGTKCVKNRRRNALNPRAASRAISRIESAKKAAKMLSRVTVRKKSSC